MAAPLDEVTRRKDGQLRFQPVDHEERQQYGQRGQEYRKYLQQRQQLEANAARTPGEDPATAAEPARRKFSSSPFVAPSADQLGREYSPPQRHQVLKPDFQVQPQPRTRGGQSEARQAYRQGAAGEQQQQDPQARRNFRSQGQSQQGQGVNQGNRQGASERPVTTVASSGAYRGQSQGASNDQSQVAPRNQSSGKSKKNDND